MFFFNTLVSYKGGSKQSQGGIMGRRLLLEKLHRAPYNDEPLIAEDQVWFFSGGHFVQCRFYTELLSVYHLECKNLSTNW